MKQILSQNYMESIYEARKTHRIILFSGMHGCGKTSQLATAVKLLKEERPPVRILNLGPADGITTDRELVRQAHSLGVGPSALCLDGADGIPNLERALGEILEGFSVTVFLTGKDTAFLEATLSETFGDALAVIRVHPLSYREFLEAHELGDSRHSLEFYAAAGGLPEGGSLSPDSPGFRSFHLMRADSFLLNQIIEPNAVRNASHVRRMLSLVARHTGEALSARQICAAFSGEGQQVSPQAILDYLGFCRASGLLIPAPILDMQKDEELASVHCWYFGDQGLRNAFVPTETPAGVDRAYSNLVFLRLISDGWRVRTGRSLSGRNLREDIGFVCDKEGKRVYLQMAGASMTTGERQRRRKALLAVRDAWPKYAVGALSDEADGVRAIFIRDLLLDGIPE